MWNRKNILRAAFWLFVAALFGGLGYAGYRFIGKLGDSALDIRSQIEPPKPLGEIDLRASDTAVGSGVLPDASEAVSSGQDLVIQSGEFAYRNGSPTVYVMLSNRGGFTASSAYISLSLYVSGHAKPVAQEIGIPAVFNTPLEHGGTLMVSVPVSGSGWTSDTVRDAKERRLLAQVVSVGDSGRGEIDYPQTSPAVALPQTGNDWGVIEPPPAAEPNTEPDKGSLKAEPADLPPQEPRITPPSEPQSGKVRENRVGSRIDLEDDAAVKRLNGRDQGIISVEIRDSSD